MGPSDCGVTDNGEKGDGVGYIDWVVVLLLVVLLPRILKVSLIVGRIG
jgi:hypothetical protein